MPVALDQRQEVTEISKNALPLLHPSRIEKMVFVSYTPPPFNCEDRADYDAWIERVNYLCDDLHWLLQLPHDKFWCQAVFDESLHKALDSFLQFGPRSHDGPLNLPEGGRQRQHELCRLVFMTYLRMSTHKESKENFITPEVFGEILYNNFLFDIPKILDLCSLFGKSNGPLLNKMIGNVFSQQPKYMDDLHETILLSTCQVLGNIAAECGIHLEGTGQTPQKLDLRSSGCTLSALSIDQLQDVLLYISDTAITLNTFLDIYTPACHVFHKFHICSVIANFYDSMIPELYNAVKQQEFYSEVQKKQFLGKARQISKCLVSIFRCILQHVCLQPILDNASNEETVSSCIEDLLHTMTSLLNERKFLAAYEGMFNFQDDVDLLLQTSSSIDPSQLEYIQAAINSAFATFGRRKSPRGNTNTGGRTSPDGAPDSLSSGATAAAPGGNDRDVATGSSQTGAGIGEQEDFQTEDYGEGAISCPRPGDAELDSLITSVKDLFPHLGEGFIELALEELDWNHEKVVSSILEEKLPTSLQELSFDLPRQVRETNQGDGQTDKEDVLESRRNVFDNDEFDLFRNKKVDMSKIHLGKKEEKVDLEDKSIIKAVQATYEAYGSVDQESIYENPQMYEDEYDDTYDTNAVGADDADSADELTNRKFMPRVLLDIERKKARDEGRDQESGDDGDDGGGDGNNGDQPPRDQFVEDPAKLREMAEQRRQSHAARRGRGGGAAPPRTRDVVGGAKGQGQSAEVLRNRKMKEKHKGQRNKANAEKKLSKGMF
ncbi:unnamed protein product [Lymnaea stagnalis]|uniref:CUE domain-containing protein n=1 Tax=Lymnaea stagnalis TaxID=6523 RepID=A0AAV2IKS0_LYMST